MQEICVNYVISGLVQGVCFRSFVVNKANSLNVKGWVRNLSNGKVEVLACGTKQALSEFESALKTGSNNSKVKDITKELTECKEYDKFILVATK